MPASTPPPHGPQSPPPRGNARARNWGEALRVYTRPQVVAMNFLGFSAGLPFLLVFSTLTAWLAQANVERSVIGFFSWIGITYSIKVFWAPVVDRLRFPLLSRLFGQRRGWMLAAQCGIAGGLVLLALTGPGEALHVFAAIALLIAFSSATQDITIVAYRIEAVADAHQGAMAAAYVFGYRVATLASGAGALYLAEYYSWSVSYLVMAALMSVGVLTTLIIREPAHPRTDRVGEIETGLTRRLHIDGLAEGMPKRIATWFAHAVISPFVEFFQRTGWYGGAILVLIAIYRISDISMGAMANPFYIDMGYSLDQIASIAKVFGFAMTIAGALLGGLAVARFGVLWPLFAGAILVAATNLLFSLLAVSEPTLMMLGVVISADNLGAGFATSAFIAYLSSLTNRAYTATQYALFSSLMTLPAKIISGFSGIVVDAQGYFFFFLYTTGLGIPTILLALFVIHHRETLARHFNHKYAAQRSTDN